MALLLRHVSAGQGWLIDKNDQSTTMYYWTLIHQTFIQYRDTCSRSKHTAWDHSHDDVIKWKHFPRYWPFVRGIHWSTVNSPHKGQWRGALMFSLICVWINGWVNNRGAGDLRRYLAHYDVTVMQICTQACNFNKQWTKKKLWNIGMLLLCFGLIFWFNYF